MEHKYEIKRCSICQKYIEFSNQLVVVEHTHYHRCCLDKLWLEIERDDRYRIINLFLKKKRENMAMRRWFGYDV